jgi:hypothetical protein
MPEDWLERLERLLSNHRRGAFYSDEVTVRLCQMAAEELPEQLAPAIPPDLLDEVRRWVEDPPEDPEQVWVSYLLRPAGQGDPDWDRFLQGQSRRLHEGMWRWHRYFTVPQPGSELAAD